MKEHKPILIVISPNPQTARRFISDLKVTQPNRLLRLNIDWKLIHQSNAKELNDIRNEVVNLGFDSRVYWKEVAAYNSSVDLGDINDRTDHYKKLINQHYGREIY